VFHNLNQNQQAQGGAAYDAAEKRAAERWPWLIDPDARWNKKHEGFSVDPLAGVERLDKRLIRVLAIDGGGIRGIVPATVLTAIEERTGRPISDLFDVFAGTSTGGLLTLGLNALKDGADWGSTEPQYSAKEIRDIYLERGPQIFSRGKRWMLKTAGGWLGPKYPATGLEAVLKEMFGSRRIADTIRRTLITSYDTERRTPVTFASDCLRFAEPRNPNPEMWQVCRATSAAPTYFPPFRLKADYSDERGPGWNFGDPFSLVDGGVAANNPALWAWYESGLGREAHSLLIVSLGTGYAKGQFKYDVIKPYGKLQWITPVLELLASGANETTHTQLNYFLNGTWQDPRDRTPEGAERIPNRPATAIRAPQGTYDVNFADGLDQRTRWTRYLRYQPQLHKAAAAMDNVHKWNLSALQEDAERYIRENEGDLFELADFLDTLADLRPAHPNH